MNFADFNVTLNDISHTHARARARARTHTHTHILTQEN